MYVDGWKDEERNISEIKVSCCAKNMSLWIDRIKDEADIFRKAHLKEESSITKAHRSIWTLYPL